MGELDRLVHAEEGKVVLESLGVELGVGSDDLERIKTILMRCFSCRVYLCISSCVFPLTWTFLSTNFCGSTSPLRSYSPMRRERSSGETLENIL